MAVVDDPGRILEPGQRHPERLGDFVVQDQVVARARVDLVDEGRDPELLSLAGTLPRLIVEPADQTGAFERQADFLRGLALGCVLQVAVGLVTAAAR